MTRFAVILYFALQIGNVYSQFSFHREYNSPNHNQCFEALEMEDGYLVVGFEYSSNSALDSYLMKISLEGLKLWEKTIDRFPIEQYRAICKDNSDGFVVAGTEDHYRMQLLIHYDHDGNELFRTTFGDSIVFVKDNLPNTVLNVGDGYVVATSGYNPNNTSTDAMLYKFDYNGNELWSTNYDINLRADLINKARLDNDEGFLLCVQSYFISSLDNQVRVIKTDKNGIELWRKEFRENHYTTQIRDAIPSPDGGYLVLMKARLSNDNDEPEKYYVISTDDVGEVVGLKMYPEELIDVRDIYDVGDGFVITGTIEDVAQIDFMLLKTDTELNEVWHKDIGNEEFEMLYHGMPTSDNGYLLIGNVFHWTPVADYDITVAKVDCEGNLEWNEECSFAETADDLLIFPNPFADNFTVQLHEIAKTNQVDIVLYNVAGQRVLESSTIDSRFISVEANRLAQGLYAYQVIVDGEVYKAGIVVKSE